MYRVVNSIKRKICLFLVNKIFAGKECFDIKRNLLNQIREFEIGKGTKIVGPIECTGQLKIGQDCWIGKNLKINGNGKVTIGDCCDIAPEVTFQTGGHLIGTSIRRAGEGKIFNQTIGNGVWIGGRSTIIGNTTIGDGCVIAGCACVVNDLEENILVGGVPARVIRKLDEN